MPRVITKTKNRAGARRYCGRCGNEIMAGDRYRSWSFRYGGTQYRCMRADCAPRASELTQSIMGEVYDAVETAQAELPGAESVADIVTIVEAVAEAAESVRSQYEEAAEPFQGGGTSGERAEELQGWVDELENFQPEEPDDETFDEEEHQETIRERSDADGVSFSQALTLVQDEWIEERGAEAAEKLEAARTEAEDLIGGCPL